MAHSEWHEGWYGHAGGAMLRAAALPVPSQDSGSWQGPDLEDTGESLVWLGKVWQDEAIARAVRYASSGFGGEVAALLDGGGDAGRVRRACVSMMRYLLRSAGRATPFGLFAGVAPAQAAGPGQAATVVWGSDHRISVRADTLWLDGVLCTLEQDAEVLTELDVVASDLLVDRGDRLECPRAPGFVSVPATSAVRSLLAAAASPVRVCDLITRILEQHPAASGAGIMRAVQNLVGQGVLLTSLRAPMTHIDPLGWAIEHLFFLPDGSATKGRMEAISALIGQHNQAASMQARETIRAQMTPMMTRLFDGSRAVLAGDLSLDCRVVVPAVVAQEMAAAVTALVRMTHRPRHDVAWNDWQREFWERYGTGAVVPVTDAVHPDHGIGWPAGFPDSTMSPMPTPITGRDRWLLQLAQHAATHRILEVELTEAMIQEATHDQPVDPRWIPRTWSWPPGSRQPVQKHSPGESFGCACTRPGPSAR